jgi:hypothetical protein
MTNLASRTRQRYNVLSLKSLLYTVPEAVFGFWLGVWGLEHLRQIRLKLLIPWFGWPMTDEPFMYYLGSSANLPTYGVASKWLARKDTAGVTNLPLLPEAVYGTGINRGTSEVRLQSARALPLVESEFGKDFWTDCSQILQHASSSSCR